MAVPIFTYNPWDYDQNTLLANKILFPELVYLYEKNQSIL